VCTNIGASGASCASAHSASLLNKGTLLDWCVVIDDLVCVNCGLHHVLCQVLLHDLFHGHHALTVDDGLDLCVRVSKRTRGEKSK
jgi:hypothetical protein